MFFPLYFKAAFWGLFAGSSLLLGAAIGYFSKIPQRIIAAVMAFGSGVLISALSFDLMDEAFRKGGLASVSTGFLGGAAVYTAANWILAKRGAKHRKRSGNQQSSEKNQPNSGLSIALGSLLDGIPESIVIGTSLIGAGQSLSLVALIAIFISNIPEGLSSSAGMKKAGRSKTYIFILWTTIVLLSAIASWVGYVVFSQFSEKVVAATMAVAAGAILSMISDTMIPEAFEVAHNFAGLITVTGFLAAFILTKITP